MLSRREEEIFKFKAKIVGDDVRIWFCGDWHVGHENFDSKLLDKYIEWAKKNKNVYIILMGDLMESVIATERYSKMIWTQRLNPLEQFYKITDLLGPLKKRVICAVSGNHEDRITNTTGIDVTDLLCRELGCYYLPNGDYVIFKVNGIEYNLAIFHGSLGSINPDYQLKKALDIWPDADLVALGHIHQIFSRDSYVFSIKSGMKLTRNRIAIRTGGFLEYPAYAQIKFLPPSALGSPIGVFNKQEKKIDIQRWEYAVK